MQDSQSGNLAIFGRFQSLTLSIRDATETYLELGQRIPIYLNGEIQIAWVLEQGLLDMAFVARTFGITEMTRSKLLSRGPRFHISFDANAIGRDLETTTRTEGKAVSLRGANNDLNNPNALLGGGTGNVGAPSSLFSGASSGGSISSTPVASGRYELMRCKVDSVSLGIMPGRRVAATRWEGVSEGITFYPPAENDKKVDA